MKRAYGGKKKHYQTKYAKTGLLSAQNYNKIDVQRIQFATVGKLHSHFQADARLSIQWKLTLGEVLRNNKRVQWFTQHYKFIKVKQIEGSLHWLTHSKSTGRPITKTEQQSITNGHVVCIWTGVDFEDIPNKNDMETHPDCTILPGNTEKAFNFTHTFDGPEGQYFQQSRWQKLQDDNLNHTPLLGFKIVLRPADPSEKLPYKRSFLVTVKLKVFLTKVGVSKQLEIQETLLNQVGEEAVNQLDPLDRSVQYSGIRRMADD